ncbi:MoaD/ThiS family protein [Moorella sulfitireducens]|uniref:MoaD/ThiS family protein n=1 Tax=Neomoorella sulfitireducens TaxID=2972948 RepID=UPI0021ABE692
MEVIVRLVLPTCCKMIERETITVSLKEGDTVETLLTMLGAKYGISWLGEGTGVIFVNQKKAGLETPLNRGDEVLLVHPIGGG